MVVRAPPGCGEAAPRAPAGPDRRSRRPRRRRAVAARHAQRQRPHRQEPRAADGRRGARASSAVASPRSSGSGSWAAPSRRRAATGFPECKIPARPRAHRARGDVRARPEVRPGARTATCETARLRHPGCDIGHVEGEWRARAAGEPPAADPDRAVLRRPFEASPLRAPARRSAIVARAAAECCCSRHRPNLVIGPRSTPAEPPPQPVGGLERRADGAGEAARPVGRSSAARGPGAVSRAEGRARRRGRPGGRGRRAPRAVARGRRRARGTTPSARRPSPPPGLAMSDEIRAGIDDHATVLRRRSFQEATVDTVVWTV